MRHGGDSFGTPILLQFQGWKPEPRNACSRKMFRRISNRRNIAGTLLHCKRSCDGQLVRGGYRNASHFLEVCEHKFCLLSSFVFSSVFFKKEKLAGERLGILLLLYTFLLRAAWATRQFGIYLLSEHKRGLCLFWFPCSRSHLQNGSGPFLGNCDICIWTKLYIVNFAN